MGRFVLNLHRNVHIDNFNGSKKVLEVNDLRNEAENEILNGVKESFSALSNLL